MADTAKQLAALLDPVSEPGTVKVDRVSREEYIRRTTRKLLKEELASVKRQRLTWGPADLTEDTSSMIGLFDPRRAYEGPFGGMYYVQNNRILTTAGVEVQLEDVPETPYTWSDKHGVKHEAPSDRQVVGEALTRHRKRAMATDPLLCPFGADYRAESQDDRMKHIYSKHPAEFADIVGLPLNPSRKAGAEESPPAAPARSSSKTQPGA
jgi:hypothetical protein